MDKVKYIFVLFLLLMALLPADISARSLLEAREYDDIIPEIMLGPPCIAYVVHDVGRIHMVLSNSGIIGLAPNGVFGPDYEEFGITYNAGWEQNLLYEAGLWVGGVIGRDTLVSTPNGLHYQEAVREFWPLPCPWGDIIYRSNVDPRAPEYDSSVSQQDFISVYTDTISDVGLTGYDSFSGRLHRPLRVKVTQKSYAWAYDYAEDLIIIDYEIGNIENRTINDVYLGFYVDNDIGKTNSNYYMYDDVCGYKKIFASKYIPGLIDTLNLVWAADNDGDPDPISGEYSGFRSPTYAIATKVLRTPTDKSDFTFNWWISSWDPNTDWGPRRSKPGGVRRFDGRLGTPVGDEAKYHIMSSGEFDYNQAETYRHHDGWLAPPSNAYSVSSGANINFLLSFGPFTMGPGEILPLTLAFVVGEDFHPGRNFDDLQLNSVWAEWIFDNPGVDTDGDGYRGESYTFCMNPKIARIDTIIVGPTDTAFDTTMSCTWSDTLWYAGDGVPDFVGARPPSSPDARLTPRISGPNEGEITILWNGQISETMADQFSQVVDFEGYRVYFSHSGLVGSYTMLSSYDVENYDRYEYYSRYIGKTLVESWEIKERPYDTTILKQMYGEDFDPTPYYDEDHLFLFYNNRTGKYERYYFGNHDWNQSDLSDTMGIHKAYPLQKYPSTMNLDTAQMFYPNEVTPEGKLKYFEYKYALRNLMPSVPYFVSVTAFDHGFPQRGIKPLETRPSDSSITLREFAQDPTSEVKRRGLDVIVYPNPYRIDGNYRDYYEGWEEPDRYTERTRALHFTNLPNVCTITIFSLDGDLIQTIEHNYPEDAPGSMHDIWNLISRNEMMIVSGIYLYSVESEWGNQIGKFVIIY